MENYENDMRLIRDLNDEVISIRKELTFYKCQKKLAKEVVEMFVPPESHGKAIDWLNRQRLGEWE